MLQIYRRNTISKECVLEKTHLNNKRPVKRLLDDVLPKKRPQAKPAVNPALTEEEEGDDEAPKEKDHTHETSNETGNASSSTSKRNEEKKKSDQEISSPVPSVQWLSQQGASSRGQLTQQSNEVSDCLISMDIVSKDMIFPSRMINSQSLRTANSSIHRRIDDTLV